MKRLVALAVCEALCGCSGAKDCPENYRAFHVSFVPKDEGDYLVKVDDCLSEYTGKMAKGSSSDENIAKAAIGYCGTYDYPTVIDGPDKNDMDREMRTALHYIITQRALNCPVPSERDVRTGNLKPRSWLPAFLQST